MTNRRQHLKPQLNIDALVADLRSAGMACKTGMLPNANRLWCKVEFTGGRTMTIHYDGTYGEYVVTSMNTIRIQDAPILEIIVRHMREVGL